MGEFAKFYKGKSKNTMDSLKNRRFFVLNPKNN
jgi:hypothetical protein